MTMTSGASAEATVACHEWEVAADLDEAGGSESANEIAGAVIESWAVPRRSDPMQPGNLDTKNPAKSVRRLRVAGRLIC